MEEGHGSSSDSHDADLTRGMEHLRPYVSVASHHDAPAHKKQPQTQPEEQDQSHTTYGVPSHIINPPRQTSKRSSDAGSNPQKRTDPFQFGSRYLEEGDDIFEFNAWDHVEVDDAFKDFAEQQYQKQRDAPVSDFDKDRYNAQPSKYWDTFYARNNANFFKDRKWLFQEFPLLATATTSPTAFTLLELGAGAGNTAFPLLAANRNPHLRVVACDFSAQAVGLIRSNPAFDAAHLRAEVWDVARAGTLPPETQEASVDAALLVFTFSALAPSQWRAALANIRRALKPGGALLLRDYARGDLAQVRFRGGRYLEENFYVRGDGTRVYFFDEEELRELFEGEGFVTGELAVDRRLLVNRKRRLKMYRAWIQGRFWKAGGDDGSVAHGQEEGKEAGKSVEKDERRGVGD